MTTEDYEYLYQLLLDRSGLFLGPGKEYLIESRLVPLAHSFGLTGIDQLVVKLREGRERGLMDSVVEVMTTNETMFFRDKTPFDELRDILLPQLIAARQSSQRLRFWSAASSTGQEAYSLAIMLRESFPQLENWAIEIVGTDLSSAAVERAKAGVYSQFEVQRGLSIQMLMRHFQQVPDGWSIGAASRALVNFRKTNLLEPLTSLGLFDVIFCRNVLIYFETPNKKSILERMRQQLRPDGVLILGAAETVLGVTDQFERRRDCKSAIYQPRNTGTAPAASRPFTAAAKVPFASH